MNLTVVPFKPKDWPPDVLSPFDDGVPLDVTANILSFTDNPCLYSRVSRHFRDAVDLLMQSYAQYFNENPFNLSSKLYNQQHKKIKPIDNSYHDVANLVKKVFQMEKSTIRGFSKLENFVYQDSQSYIYFTNAHLPEYPIARLPAMDSAFSKFDAFFNRIPSMVLAEFLTSYFAVCPDKGRDDNGFLEIFMSSDQFNDTNDEKKSCTFAKAAPLDLISLIPFNLDSLDSFEPSFLNTSFTKACKSTLNHYEELKIIINSKHVNQIPVDLLMDAYTDGNPELRKIIIPELMKRLGVPHVFDGAGSAIAGAYVAITAFKYFCLQAFHPH
jgi:hypothetical protein